MKVTKAEQAALDEIWETTFVMLQAHPDLSSFSVDDWEVRIKGAKMPLQFTGYLEMVEGDGE